MQKVGVLLGSYQGGYQYEICRGMEAEVARRGLQLEYFSAILSQENITFMQAEKSVFDLARYQKGIDAWVIFSTNLLTGFTPAQLEELTNQITENKSIPFVSLGVPLEKSVNILNDNSKGMEMIMEHLIGVHQFKNFAYVSGPFQNHESTMRYHAFLKTLNQHKLSFDEKHFFEGRFRREDGAKAVEHWQERELSDIDVIVCANDEMAIGVSNKLMEYELLHRVKVCGFDNITLAENNLPPLTTVAQPMIEIGEKAISELNQLFKGRPLSLDSSLDIYMHPNLVVRQSCGCSKQINEQQQNLIKGSIQKSGKSIRERILESLKTILPEPAIRFIGNEFDSFLKRPTEVFYSNRDIMEQFIGSLLRALKNNKKDPDALIGFIDNLFSELKSEISDNHFLNASYLSSKKLIDLEKKKLDVDRFYFSNWAKYDLSLEVAQCEGYEQLWDVLTHKIPHFGVSCLMIILDKSGEQYHAPIKDKEYHVPFYYCEGIREKNSRYNFDLNQICENNGMTESGCFITKPLHYREHHFGFMKIMIGHTLEPNDYNMLKLVLSQALYNLWVKSNLQQRKQESYQNNDLLKNILEQTSEIYLTLDQSMRIIQNHSRRSEDVFEKPVNGLLLSDVLYPDDKENQDVLSDVFLECMKKLSQGENSDKYRKILPKQVAIKSQTYDVNFVFSDQIIVVLKVCC